MSGLSFGGFQVAVAVAFAVIAFSLMLFFAFAARQAGREVPFDRVRGFAYRARPAWLALLAVLLGAMVCVSLFFLPYSGSSAAGKSVSVRVIGGQFYWSLTPDTLTPEFATAGSKVVFEVTSADVNHGFGIYDPDGVLIGNVQAMPGYTNELELTLEKPGSYLISCLEFCGRDHHKMYREFEVTEG